MAAQAIPTMWDGIQYRSRLEARWAAFFAALGWHADYEPIDLKGYIPDFVLRFPVPLLVEVKPFLQLDDDIIKAAHEKVIESGWDSHGIIVGAGIDWHQVNNLTDGLVGIGVFFDYDGCEGLDDTAFVCTCPNGDHYALSVINGGYGCRVCCGGHKGEREIYGFGSAAARRRILDHWKTAGNSVQWMGRR